ncbi:MAG TPA: hypothetical protein VF613_08025 [Longimicrobium sp.]|jgi:hypothetical protein
MIPLLAALLATAPTHAAAPPAPPHAAADTVVHDTLRELEVLANAVVDTLVAHGVKTPRGILVVTMDAGGGGAELNIVGGNVPEAHRASVMPAAAAYINRRGVETPIDLTIHLERVERPAVVIPAAPRTAPVPRNGDKVENYMAHLLAAHPNLSRGWHRAVVDMYVNRQGRVAIVNIREWAGEVDINQYLTALAYELEFTPARQGGQPAPCWIRQSFAFGVDR